MKKRLIPLFLCFQLLFSGCGGEKNASGPVTAIFDGGSTVVLRVEGGKEIAFRLSPETPRFSWVEGVNASDLKTGMEASAEYTGWKRTYTAPDGRKYPSYEAKFFFLDAARMEPPVTLSDGTEVWLWKSVAIDSYKLADGTQLLWWPNAPGNLHAEASDEVNQAIWDHYSRQGLLYDPMAELERAYAAWQEAPEGAPFDGFHVEQTTYHSAAAPEVLYYYTSLILPVDVQEGTAACIGTAFSRETGEVIPMETLFTCPPEELFTQLMAAAEIQDEALIAEMEEAFQPEQIVFSQDGGLEVWFPSLSSQSLPHVVGIQPEKAAAILQNWAIPEA